MAAQPDYSAGSMLALYPPPAIAGMLAIPGGLDLRSLHLTVAYCGDADGVSRRALRKAAKVIAGATTSFTVQISGHARFTGGDLDVIVALADAPELEDLRALAVAELAACGIAIPRDHGYTPHLSLSYIAREAPDPAGRIDAFPVPFTALTAVHGGKACAYHLDGQASDETARVAFAAGWALSGGPVTPRTAAAAAAAAEAAREHPGPHVAEVTLRIGKLEGTWALYFRRREDLIAGHQAGVLAAWGKALAGLGAAGMVRSYRAQVMTPGMAPDPVTARNLGNAAAAGLLAGVYACTGWRGIEDATVAALRAARAEGKAGVLALAAQADGLAAETASTPYSFDKAYQAFWDQLANLAGLPLAAQQWIQQMIRAAATDLGRLLATLAAAQATDAEMEREVLAALGATGDTVTGRAVTLFIDQAMSQAMSQASIDVYAAEGLATYSILTAGDERVCEMPCLQAEAGSPYPVGDGPVPGLHPRCRCVPVPESPLPYQQLADRYLN